jgi:predicted nicotinamide N-methyase
MLPCLLVWVSVLATAARAPPALWDASAQEDAALAEVTTAGRTWHAGHALGMRLASDWAGLVRDKLVLEVGTGTGVAGLAAASAGARRVLLTDMHLQTAQRNVDIYLEKAAAARAAAAAAAAAAALPPPSLAVETCLLPWGDAQGATLALAQLGGTPDVVLAADVVYTGFNLVALFETIVILAAPRTTLVIVAYHERQEWVTEQVCCCCCCCTVSQPLPVPLRSETVHSAVRSSSHCRHRTLTTYELSSPPSHPPTHTPNSSRAARTNGGLI